MKLVILLLILVSCSSKPKNQLTHDMNEFADTDLETLLVDAERSGP